MSCKLQTVRLYAKGLGQTIWTWSDLYDEGQRKSTEDLLSMHLIPQANRHYQRYGKAPMHLVFEDETGECTWVNYGGPV